MHGAYLVGREAAGVLDALRRRSIQLVDEQQHRVAVEHRSLGRGTHVARQLLRLGFVLLVEPGEAVHHDRHDHEDHPRTQRLTRRLELRHDDDDVDDG